MTIPLEAVAFVANSRKQAVDDNWGTIISTIELASHIPAIALQGLQAFSHLEIIFCFHQAADEDIVFSGHPRGNKDYPLMGIFAQRKKDRPNHMGSCVVELLAVADNTLTVRNLDAIDGTPVLDIKPVFKEFLPRGTIRQPLWVADLMKNYW